MKAAAEHACSGFKKLLIRVVLQEHVHQDPQEVGPLLDQVHVLYRRAHVQVRVADVGDVLQEHGHARRRRLHVLRVEYVQVLEGAYGLRRQQHAQVRRDLDALRVPDHADGLGGNSH